MLSGSTASTSPSTVDSLLQGSTRSTMSSLTSHGSMPQPQSRQMHSKLQPLSEDDVLSHYEMNQTHPSLTGLVAPHVSAGPSNSLPPLPHPALDLILIVSLPPPSDPRSTTALKLCVIKASLDLILAALRTKDCLSLVTFEVGPGGHVRKVPYLCVGKALSRGELSKFVDEIGRSDEGQDVEFLVRASKEEKTDVVTAVNHVSPTSPTSPQPSKASSCTHLLQSPAHRPQSQDLRLPRGPHWQEGLKSMQFPRRPHPHPCLRP
ncbi:uncharacterized protein EDB91DRAFT_320315 [Suillus paluster]|uniref:uncharacterized protein n=1 Tax=Suillus paluster TaxID=48578 RepID=UPI001B86E45A|nr:uncharacterized protein EDB91DRAFT_320315 [Suillus paluster]KAG1741892.1 hypothetical protein EDB91DRAFT_320315 [Suillus paluster]